MELFKCQKILKPPKNLNITNMSQTEYFNKGNDSAFFL